MVQPWLGEAHQKFPVNVKHFLAQAHKVKTYYCSYQVFISLQDPCLLEMQCPPRQKHYKPTLWDFAEAIGSWRPCSHDAEAMLALLQRGGDGRHEQWARLALSSSDPHPENPALGNSIISTDMPWPDKVNQGDESLASQVLPSQPFVGLLLSSPLFCCSNQILSGTDFIHTATAVPCTHGRSH